jgi:hypothetical protein
VNTRTRWLVGILLVLVIALAIGLIIAVGDDSNDAASTTSRPNPGTEKLTEPTTTAAPTTTSAPPNGGTPVPGTTSSPNGQGGL